MDDNLCEKSVKCSCCGAGYEVDLPFDMTVDEFKAKNECIVCGFRLNGL